MKRIAREKTGTPEGEVARRKLKRLRQGTPFVPFKSYATFLTYDTEEEWLRSEEFIGRSLSSNRTWRRVLDGS